MSEHELLLSDFDFDLPLDRIAQFPLKDRASSRLLHVMPDRLEDWHFRDIVNLLRSDDLLVMNNTKVIKARLLGKKETGGAVEVLMERRYLIHQMIDYQIIYYICKLVLCNW